MNARVEVQEPSMHDSNICEQSQIEDKDTRAEDPDENQASDGDDSIIDETLDISAVKDRILSKSKKYNIPQAIYPSESLDEMPRPRCRKRVQRGSGTVRAGVYAIFIRRNSNQFPSTVSKKLQARRGRAGSRESKCFKQAQPQVSSSTPQRQWYLT